MVGAIGFEPTTPCTPCRCASRLRHAPTAPNDTTGPWSAQCRRAGPLREGRSKVPGRLIGSLSQPPCYSAPSWPSLLQVCYIHQMRFLIVLMLFLSPMWSWLLAAPTPTHACTCIHRSGIQEFYDSSTHVFRGTVVDRQEDSLHDSTTYTIAIDRVWKGPLINQTDLWANNTEWACGIHLSTGGWSIFYSDGESISLCSRVVPGNSAEDLAALGEGFSPASSNVRWLIFAGIGILGLVVAAGTAFLVRSRQ